MNILTKILGAALAVAVLPNLASAAAWTSTDRWGSWTNGGYTVYVDEWGSTAPVSAWANSGTNFGFSGNWTGGGIKIYCHNQKNYNNANPRTVATANCSGLSGPSSGQYGWLYDTWIPNEVMVLIKRVNPAGEWGTKVGSKVSLGGRTYDIWKPSNNAVTIFVANPAYTSGNTSLSAIHSWTLDHGYGGGGKLQNQGFGGEVTSGNGSWTIGKSTF